MGKTTLALNIAIALSMSEQMAHAHPGDARVCLIDADRQHTAMAFTEIRRRRVAREMGYKSPLNAPCGPGYCAMDLQGPTIRTQVPQVERVNPYVVIDVGGRDSGSLRAALTISNLVLVPTAPRSFDLWSVDQTANLIREAREINADLRAVAVLNGADPAGRDNEEAIAALTDMGLEVAPCRIGRRKAFPDAAAEGFGVLEYRGSSAVKARQEFMQLFTFLFPEKELSL